MVVPAVIVLEASCAMCHGHQRANGLAYRCLQESTVVPLLMSGLQNLCKERPEDPVEYLANYLLQHNTRKEGQQRSAAAAAPPPSSGS
jgi:hypothetical protein